MAGFYYWLWVIQSYAKTSWFLAPICVGLVLTVIHSAACLISGGAILTFVGINFFLIPHNFVNTDEVLQYWDRRSDYFAIGRDLELQTWVIIISTGYCMIWKGLAFVHGFLRDWKASHEARQAAGGNHGVNFHSLREAVESLMVQHIPRYRTLQYTIAILLCVAGFGFHFGATKVGIRVIRNIPRERIDMHPIDISTPSDIGASDSTQTYMKQSHRLPEAWLRDKPGGEENSVFMHQSPFGDEMTGPPAAVIMASTLTVCVPFEFVVGTLTSRQTVMVANMTIDEGDFRMRRVADGWNRIDSGINILIGELRPRVVIEYRVGDPGTLQIQWAKHGEWLTNDSADPSEPVIQRITYDMHYAVAEVKRYIDGPRKISHPSEELPWKCSHQYTRIPDDWHSLHQVLIKIRSREDSLITIEETDASHPLTRALIDSYMSSPRRSLLASTSLLVRATMTGWNPSGKQIRLLEENEFPFGAEIETMEEHASDSSIRYPYFEGSIWVAGCKKSAAVVHLTVGILALLVAGVRIICTK
ncbi:unnamed protein product [Clonostachys solani]|uniref:Uncharacterized protein n=1 Tax=Clonostachys solani TaxID=160281 RepID=A0A9N9ZB89_9HYPO|nr:unnamed protein product [Clonostachys solani]